MPLTNQAVSAFIAGSLPARFFQSPCRFRSAREQGEDSLRQGADHVRQCRAQQTGVDQIRH